MTEGHIRMMPFWVSILRSTAVPRKCLGIVGQDPSDSNSNRLHVDNFRFCFVHFALSSIFHNFLLNDR